MPIAGDNEGVRMCYRLDKEAHTPGEVSVDALPLIPLDEAIVELAGYFAGPEARNMLLDGYQLVGRDAVYMIVPAGEAA